MTMKAQNGHPQPAGSKNTSSLLRQCASFGMHLRWHYQVGILSGSYLLGGLVSGMQEPADFWFHFFVIHLLLFGGATAYNSFWDRDEGPIGGLRNPPALADWARPASVGLQFSGLILSIPMGLIYMVFYALSMLLFWLYSHPSTRWKGHPWLSMLAIGVSTGTNSVIFGYLAAGGPLSLYIILPAAGAALMILSMYPISQIFQLREDKKRGDRTYVVVNGPGSVLPFYLMTFFPGAGMITAGFFYFIPSLVVIFAVITLAAGFLLSSYIRKLKGDPSEYPRVMKMKYLSSLLFVIFLAGAIFFG